ncbi:hypothetical protein MNBD_GAMMA12-1706 [hydrothermal vent metagenome]|uniref:Delta-aminolevulinic acid dehydratase n=1 Tax=hydrothermal vent metagenome TaxID=652676 RepID=A0A3B0Y7C4_9ZZZZ
MNIDMNNDLSHTLQQTLDTAYQWSRTQSYQGYNKHDALNSPILKLLMGWSKWPRMLAIQGVMRFPINLRPYLMTHKSYNPKGLALIIQGLLRRYQTSQQTEYLEEAEQLLQLLIELRSNTDTQWQGTCWGYHYPWQDPGFFAPSKMPNAVVTCFVCEAFLDAYRVTQKQQYLDTVSSALTFFNRHLTILKDTEQELCYSYMPVKMSMRVMDVSILIAAVMMQYSQLSANQSLEQKATRLARYVIKQQTKEGAWFYTDPPQDSHIRHDNYHTGFILDALARYHSSGPAQCWHQEYSLGLKFYLENLFNPDGSPRWMSDCNFPHDIHGAAQGIITFSRHCADPNPLYAEMAQNIFHWALNNMYHPQGRFYYQQGAWRIKKFTLLRWCNAWMMRAMADYQFHLHEQSQQSPQSIVNNSPQQGFGS